MRLTSASLWAHLIGYWTLTEPEVDFLRVWWWRQGISPGVGGLLQSQLMPQAEKYKAMGEKIAEAWNLVVTWQQLPCNRTWQRKQHVIQCICCPQSSRTTAIHPRHVLFKFNLKSSAITSSISNFCPFYLICLQPHVCLLDQHPIVSDIWVKYAMENANDTFSCIFQGCQMCLSAYIHSCSTHTVVSS